MNEVEKVLTEVQEEIIELQVKFDFETFTSPDNVLEYEAELPQCVFFFLVISRYEDRSLPMKLTVQKKWLCIYIIHIYRAYLGERSNHNYSSFLCFTRK